MLGHLSSKDEIFQKDYVPPPIKKTKEDPKVIHMPANFLKGLPIRKPSKKRKRVRLAITKDATKKIKELRLKDKKDSLKIEMELEKQKRV